MPRRRRGSLKRKIAADSKYKSEVLGRLINAVMYDGEKRVAEGIVYDALDIIEKKLQKPAMDIFDKAMQNIKPQLEVKSRRIGGANYQVPVEVTPTRQMTLALRWLKTYSRARSGKTMAQKLAAEIMDAYNNAGGAIKKKEDVFKMAEANRAFAHYRW